MKYSLFNPTPYETHMLVYERIASGSEVLDVGCATGYFAKKLKRKNCKVWGIDVDEKALKIAKKYCEETYLLDLESVSSTSGESSSATSPSVSLWPTHHTKGFHSATPGVSLTSLPYKRKFDYILLLDVVEHMQNPKPVLSLLKGHLKKTGVLIISTPNIAFISIRLALLFGKFEYQKLGILDENHVRFFTKKTLLQLITNCGLKLLELDTASGFSQITKIGNYLNYIPKYWQYKITKLWDTLFAYQFIAVTQLF